LLPAFFALGGGESVEVRALWGLRVVSALALGGALWLAIRTFQRDGLPSIAVTAAGTAFLLDPKIVDFAMNGMETGLLVFFVTLTWYAFASGARLWPCAIGLAGLQWTRPDGLIFFGALAGVWLIFEPRVMGRSWREKISTVTRAVVLGIVLYLPWFAFAWVYYGSPVPHTILAKTQQHAIGDVAKLLVLYPWRLLLGETPLHDIFRPTYFFFGGWPESLAWFSRILTLGAALTWTWPRVAAAGRMASAAFFLGGFYVSYIPPFPWYYPGWQSIGWVTWAYLLHALWNGRVTQSWATAVPAAATRIAAALIVLLQAGLIGCVAWQMRAQQTLIENGHRREIGRWLENEAKPGDIVFLECLGYIGYYSKHKMLDFPGLSAPEVVNARRSGHHSFAKIIAALNPNWIVLRPSEEARVFGELPALRQSYRLVRTFDVKDDIDALSFLPGHGFLYFDAVFRVYGRIP
jgi:hypothetical protein